MDLVVGSTGLVGQQVALGLGRLGRRVRALVRCGTHHEKAAPLLSAGVEIVDADLTKPESLPSACAGVETLLTTATSMPQGKEDRKSTRLNSSHGYISYAVFCLKRNN